MSGWARTRRGTVNKAGGTGRKDLNLHFKTAAVRPEDEWKDELKLYKGQKRHPKAAKPVSLARVSLPPLDDEPPPE